MPDQTDWILLKKTINQYKHEVVNIWGHIDRDNAEILSKNKFRGKNLFEFFLAGNHFYDANTLASCIELFDESNIELVYKYHHLKYKEIVKIFCSDKMILLYEEFHNKIHINSVLFSEEEIESNFSKTYRVSISERYEKIVEEESTTCKEIVTEGKFTENILLELLDEFNFLTHIYLEDFYYFLDEAVGINLDSSSVEKSLADGMKFVELYKKYMEFVPLIYRLVNEYYLEYVKYYLKMIDGVSGNSFIIVAEYYENLKKIVSELPKKYIDYRYQDKLGNNILYYLACLPILSKNINREIYQIFLESTNEIVLDLKNNKGDTVFHTVVKNSNLVLLEELIKWMSINLDKKNIIDMVTIRNSSGKTIFDIIFNKNKFEMINLLLDYMLTDERRNLLNKLIENFEIVESIPSSEKIFEIYLCCINYFMEEIFSMKQNILFDMENYSVTKSKITKLLLKCPDEINFDCDYYLQWLRICIKINEEVLFKSILLKYFSNRENQEIVSYLNKTIFNGTNLMTIAIVEQKNYFVKELLNFETDLLVCDKPGRNNMILSLETKNVDLIRLIVNHIEKIPKYAGMVNIMNIFIELLEEKNSGKSVREFGYIECLTKFVDHLFKF